MDFVAQIDCFCTDSFCTDNFLNDLELSVKLFEKTAESNSKSAGASENKEIKEDDQVGNTTVTVSTSPPKLTSDVALPIVEQSSFDSSSDTLPTSTVESKSDIDFCVPAKKLASTATMFSFGTGHEKPTSLITKNIGAVSSSLISAEPNLDGDAVNQNKPGNFSNFETSSNLLSKFELSY